MVFLCAVDTGRDLSSPSGPVGVEKFASGPVHSLILMGAEKISLGLKQVCGQSGGGETVEIAKGAGKGWDGDGALQSSGADAVQGLLRFNEGGLEKGIYKQIGEIRGAGKGGGDVVEKGRSDDAAAPPDLSNARRVQLPPIVDPGGFSGG